MISERLDHHRAEEGLPAVDVAHQLLADGLAVVVRGQRAHQRRPHELGGLAVERRQQPRRDGRIRLELEVAVGGRPDAVVGGLQCLGECVARIRQIETVQQHQRTELHVAVLVPADGGPQRGTGDRGVRAAHRPRRLRAHRVVEVAELTDQVRELLRGGLRRSAGVACNRQRQCCERQRR